jgi:hypothetical protein
MTRGVALTTSQIRSKKEHSYYLYQYLSLQSTNQIRGLKISCMPLCFLILERICEVASTGLIPYLQLDILAITYFPWSPDAHCTPNEHMMAISGYLGCQFPKIERRSGSIPTSLLIHQEKSRSVSDHLSLPVWIGYPHRPAYSLLLCICSNPHMRTRREEFVNRGEGEMRTARYHCHDR